MSSFSRKRSWTESQLRLAVMKSTSLAQVIRKLGLVPAGGNYLQVSKIISLLNIDISHFTGKGWNKGKEFIKHVVSPLADLLVENSYYGSYKLKNRLFKEGLKIPQCELCGWSELTPDGRITVELDHINGNHLDNRLQNLRILCPNCHSLQTTHRGMNKVKYRHRGPVAEW